MAIVESVNLVLDAFNEICFAQYIIGKHCKDQHEPSANSVRVIVIFKKNLKGKRTWSIRISPTSK